MNGCRVTVAVVGLLFSIALAVAAARPAPAFALEDETAPCSNCSCVGRYQSVGWQVYETQNFRFHCVGREPQLAELARTCEGTRLSLRRVWLAVENDEAWSPKCDVFLYATASHYARCSGMAPETRGTSNLRIGSGKVWLRRIHLRIDQVGYVEHVLPHELTHVVLADRFSTQQIPRWADEGIAMLNEPPQRREELEQLLAKARRTGSVLPFRELLTAKSYPADQARATIFFAQSVAFVDYLKSQHSAAEVIRLIETAQRTGYDQAIRDTLSIDGIAALESQWTTWLAERTRSRGTIAARPTRSVGESGGTAAAALTRASKSERRPGG